MLAGAWGGGGRCKAWVGFSVKLAHRVTASCDLLLVPSRFEPSGVNSMRAQRYGTVPVVHAVGGLRDSVDSVVAAHDDDDAPTATGTGWTYSPGSAEQMVMALCEALTTYRCARQSTPRPALGTPRGVVRILVQGLV